MTENLLEIDKNEELWICSDLHLGHDREFIWGKRGFKSSVEHESWLITNLRINIIKFFEENPDKNLIIFHLGDLSFNDAECDRAKKFFDLELLNDNLEVYTTPGNHSFNLLKLENTEYNDNIFPEQGTITIANAPGRQAYKNLIYSHYPLLNWPSRANGVICGHCHGNETCLNLPERNNIETVKLGKILDCGVDNALKNSKNQRCYFTIAEIQKILQQKEDIFNKLKTPGQRTMTLMKP